MSSSQRSWYGGKFSAHHNIPISKSWQDSTEQLTQERNDVTKIDNDKGTFRSGSISIGAQLTWSVAKTKPV